MYKEMMANSEVVAAQRRKTSIKGEKFKRNWLIKNDEWGP